MRPTKLSKAKTLIFRAFENNERKIYPKKEFSDFLEMNWESWSLSRATSKESIIDMLVEEGYLRRYRLGFTNQGAPGNSYTVYSWLVEPTAIELVQAAEPKAFMSHSTAMYLHGLTEQIPYALYFKVEKLPRVKRNLIQQLDPNLVKQAFQKEPRRSNTMVVYNNYTLYYLVGSITGDLGITVIEHGNSIVRLTSIERTLIDIVVRPHYSGGISEILKAFSNAKKKVSVNKLSSILQKLNYTYPYHQAIGFYMQQTGYSTNQLALMKGLGISIDFYLTHRMKLTEYSQEWKLFYPKGMQ